jgi:hypothetical protein
MRQVECILIDDCLAPKKVGNAVRKKGFRRGQRVIGSVTNIALTPDSQVLALKTKDGYIIPEPFLNIIGEVGDKKEDKKYFADAEYVEIVEDNDESEKSVTEVVDSLKASKIISDNSLKSKRVVNFAFAGAAIGLVYSMIKGQNKLVSSAIGAVIGGIIGNHISGKIK